MVDPCARFGLTRVTPQQFSAQIQFLVEHDFHIVRISDYLNSVKKTKLVTLTFDDGYESIYHYAYPVLKQHRLPANVFVNPAFVGHYNTWDLTFGNRVRHMDWQQLKELHNSGWEVGCHGMTHRDLTRLSAERVERELQQAKDIISERVASCSPVLSYPFGNANGTVVESAQKMNFECGLTMGMFNKNMALHFSIQRTGIYRFDSLLFFKLKACAKFNAFFRLMQQVLDKCSNATVACKQKKWSFY